MKQMKKLLEANTGSGRRRVSEVFRDFVEISAITLRNAVDRHEWDAREARYLEVVGTYDREEITRFVEALAQLTLELGTKPRDVLGELYMSLDLGNDRLGQFFTPYEVSAVMARLSLGNAASTLAPGKFISLQEPSCGAGGMIVAAAETLRSQGVDYQTVMHVTATDLDATAVHMTYLQCSLLYIPALVVHGNTLTQETFDVWPTLAHVRDGWGHKLAARSDVSVTPVH